MCIIQKIKDVLSYFWFSLSKIFKHMRCPAVFYLFFLLYCWFFALVVYYTRFFIFRPLSSHLRTICKARSIVDYAWDDHYAPKLLILQVFENKSNFYDPQKSGMGPPLVYTNDVFIKFAHSFGRQLVYYFFLNEEFYFFEDSFFHSFTLLL